MNAILKLQVGAWRSCRLSELSVAYLYGLHEGGKSRCHRDFSPRNAAFYTLL